jgi:membrane glycosyltransferase
MHELKPMMRREAGPQARSDDRIVPSAGAANRPERPLVRRRRRIMLFLNSSTFALLLAAMVFVLLPGGLILGEWAMLVAYALTLPWLCIGFWNAAVGFLLTWRFGESATAVVTPAIAAAWPADAITTQTAIVMPIRNENPDVAIGRLERMAESLSAAGHAKSFAFHVLSDSTDEAIRDREETLVENWKAKAPYASIHYRRRFENHGFKAGNIAEFLDCHGKDCDFFLPLDADSVMGPEAILRLVRIMQANPGVGMLQSLVTGLPARSFFTRAFQFGMRHGMRSFTLGSAWWQADCGPNWGHNVLIRAEPFKDYCMLPELPGRGPLSGHILSHDQVEAALMRRAGYETRVLAEESDSHEENPPSVAEFIQRELRWCLGNMQYFKLLGLPGLRPVSRVQLALAILMYLSAPAWITFIFLGAGIAALPGQVAEISPELGFGLFVVLMTLNLTPKLMGVAQELLTPGRPIQYGGRSRLLLGSLVEILFGILIAPIVAFAIAQFSAGLLFGQRFGWEVQRRNRDRLRMPEAVRHFYPQTVTGILLAGWLALTAPWALAFGSPVILSLAGSIPISMLSTHPALGRWSRRMGLFDVPEEAGAKDNGQVAGMPAPHLALGLSGGVS